MNRKGKNKMLAEKQISKRKDYILTQIEKYKRKLNVNSKLKGGKIKCYIIKEVNVHERR